jgi:hypothetical protein
MVLVSSLCTPADGGGGCVQARPYYVRNIEVRCNVAGARLNAWAATESSMPRDCITLDATMEQGHRRTRARVTARYVTPLS